MRHFDEHMLELFVLGSSKTESQREEIERHLEECAGCRSLVEQMRSFYAEFYTELAKHPPGDDESNNRIVFPGHKQPTAQQRGTSGISLTPVTRLQRFQHFARTHPIMIGGSTFAMMALTTLVVMNTGLFPFVGDGNPAFVRFNLERDVAEVMNKERKPLWDVHSHNLADRKKLEEKGSVQSIAVTDLDGDGTNEVVTVLEADGDEQASSALRIYNHKGALLTTKRFAEPTQYMQQTYNEIWKAHSIAITRPDSSGKRDILVSWSGNRSPFVLTRHNSEGEILGTFWHSGATPSMTAMDVFGDGKERLLLMGLSDTGDTTGRTYPCVTILDIEKITGSRKSVVSPGHLQPFSDAEVMYVRFPRSAIAEARRTSEAVQRLRPSTPEMLSFGVGSFADEYDFEFTFSRSMSPLAVYSTAPSEQVFTLLARQGVLKGKLDEAYLDSLKSGIRYFDGSRWTENPVRIDGKSVPPDKKLNPSYFIYNTRLKRIDVFNVEDRLLWSVPCATLEEESVRGEQKSLPRRTVVADIDGDNMNELLTTHGIGNPQNRQQLHVLDYSGKTITQRSFSISFNYLDREYSRELELGFVTTIPREKKETHEIWLSATSHGRSPFVALRMNHKAEILGGYWHFGYVGHIIAGDIDRDGKEEITLAGLNDMNDEKELSFPVVVVLDPMKVVGHTKSSVTPGFAFPTSQAEKYYVRFPFTDINEAVQRNFAARGPTPFTDEVFYFEVRNTFEIDGVESAAAFSYFFDRNMAVREVKSSTPTNNAYALLKAKGKVHGTIDEAYLANLKTGVRYWNGRAWTNDVTTISVGPLTAH